MRKARVTPLLVAALLAASPAVTASDGSRAIVRLEVDAPADCTTREELAARIAARSRRIGFADDAAVTVHVTVAPGPAGRYVAGALTITRSGAPAAARRITAASCEQASDGLALVIALALDPGSPDTVDTPPPADVKPPAPPPRGATVVVTPAVSAPPAPARTEWSAEAGAQTIFGPAPRAMPGIRVGARFTRDRSGSVWSPALVVSVVHAWTGDLGEPGGTATFTLDAANLDACPLRLAAGRWEARACVSLLVGRLAAAGSNTYAPASVDRSFAAGGASLLLGADLGPRLVLGAGLEAAASWIRDAYAFSPTVFHRAAAVTLAGGLWLGLRFR